jgi:rare lipoprotein A
MTMHVTPKWIALVAFLFAGCAAELPGAAAPRSGYRPPLTQRAAPDPLMSAGTESAVAAPGGRAQVGEASYYGDKFRGKKTASGEAFDPAAFTAAHRTLPFGTYVEVRRRDTGRAIVVRINDRGPFGKSARIIDVAYRAAVALDMVRDGVVPVELRVVSGP